MRFCYYIHLLLITFSVGFFASWSAGAAHLAVPNDLDGYKEREERTKYGDKFIDIKRQYSIVTASGEKDIIEYTISFPHSGKQPSPEDAVKYSCANIESEDVTEWYMKMFGWTKCEGETPLKCGYRKSNVAAPIITMGNSMRGHEQAFWEELRTIASNPVGRVLLYRLLIEIRRTDSKGDGCMEEEEVQEEDQGAKELREERNACRHINIRSDKQRKSFNYSSHTIKFVVQNPQRKMTSVCADQKKVYRTIVLYERPNDIGLFHEMLHWYHYLRNRRRYITERLADNGTVKLNGYKKKSNTPYIDIGRYYWDRGHGNNEDNADNSKKWRVSARPWLGSCLYPYPCYVVNFEEIRTILGSHSDVTDYINGDDLSENLYRVARKCCMRFGHSNLPYYEDATIIKRAAATCNANRIPFKKYKLRYVPINSLDNLQMQDRPSLSYHKTKQRGVGACKMEQSKTKLNLVINP